jgi:hypothetical protein
MKNTNEQRPFILEVEEAKGEMAQCINSIMQRHQLPFYFTEMILADIYNQVRAGAQRELATAQEQVLAQSASEE